MNPVRKQRLLIIVGALAGVALATGLLLYAISENLNLFYTPQQVAEGEAPLGQRMRVGGLVVEGSVRRDQDTLENQFDLTDGIGTFTVYYTGILPDLFREGQGIVANGTLVSTTRFEATEVLAKHDEQYMPPEVMEALQRAGHPAASEPGPEPEEGVSY
ncbi:cytochrome c maturation protein CcmE [Isoalcanivorax indicus]|uniref:cytochrome c maturation protein CcmE n=1 Tax=Isoalcanivorax indicus TaxID=2202653 RepID=UPI000DB911DB|nr:cytochrome c maturation protein CcmE [Isoalcanivorax indicus]